jgi:imidazolonepropionase
LSADTPAPWERLWVNCHIATMAGADPFYGAIDDGAVAVRGDRIVWVGEREQLPDVQTEQAREQIDLGGAWLTPGLIDPHTHLAFAGERSGEFEQRLRGASYQDIARTGGGILSTMRAVRETEGSALADQTTARAARLASLGVTTVEIKSGYGMSLKDERKQLQAARCVGERLAMRVSKTFLAAHALPPEFASRRTEFLAYVRSEVMPALAAEGLIDAVDAFCEHIAFSLDEVAALFESARALGLPVKLHADQLSDGSGAELAARYEALSADHLEYTSERGVECLARAGTVAVLLPAAFYFLRERSLPPVEALRSAGVRIAIASDCNPGTAPLISPTTAMNLACIQFRLAPHEALAGYTREAARALGLLHETGTIEVGKSADFAIWRCSTPAELSYWIDGMVPVGRVFRGRPDPNCAGIVQ